MSNKNTLYAIIDMYDSDVKIFTEYSLSSTEEEMKIPFSSAPRVISDYMYENSFTELKIGGSPKEYLEKIKTDILFEHSTLYANNEIKISIF